MNITIIAYRPDHTDVCRGCRMGSTESDMQYGVFDNFQEAAEFWAGFIADNEVRDIYEYSEYELSFVINGVDWNEGGPDEDFDYTIYNDMEALARVKADRLIVEYKEKEQLKKQVAEDKRIESERKQAIATVARLQEKHNL